MDGFSVTSAEFLGGASLHRFAKAVLHFSPRGYHRYGKRTVTAGQPHQTGHLT